MSYHRSSKAKNQKESPLGAAVSGHTGFRNKRRMAHLQKAAAGERSIQLAQQRTHSEDTFRFVTVESGRIPSFYFEDQGRWSRIKPSASKANAGKVGNWSDYANYSTTDRGKVGECLGGYNSPWMFSEQAINYMVGNAGLKVGYSDGEYMVQVKRPAYPQGYFVHISEGITRIPDQLPSQDVINAVHRITLNQAQSGDTGLVKSWMESNGYEVPDILK